MNKRLVVSVCLSLLFVLAACGGSNEAGGERGACGGEAREGMGEAKLSGDDVYGTKLVLQFWQKPDQSSARNLIESVAPFLDGRSDFELKQKIDKLNDEYKASVRSELELLEGDILAPEAIAELKASREKDDESDDDYKRTKTAWKILSEEKQPDGRVLVTVSQDVHTRRKKWNSDEIVEENQEMQERYYCAEVEGQWVIDGKEGRRKGAGSTEEEPKWEWEAQNERTLSMYYMAQDGGDMNVLPDKRPTLKTDSPKATGEAFMNQLKFIQSDLRYKLMIDAALAVGSHVEGAFSKGMRDKSKEDFKKMSESASKGKHTIKDVNKVSDSEAEVTVTMRGNGKGPERTALLKMKKTADGWRITEAGMLTQFGDREPTYSKRGSVYQLY